MNLLRLFPAAARLLIWMCLLCASWTHGQVNRSGSLKTWHTVTFDFSGPGANETDDQPNSFLDYRLRVTFIGPDDRRYVVPGFFDGDGHGGGDGNIWRVRFTPDQAGQWRYQTSFRQGENVAVSLETDAGAAADFDEAAGSFKVEPRDTQAPGFLKWGRLEYVNGHYLKFRDGPYWIKGGTDSPENFLAYAGFDNTPASHDYDAHQNDWNPSDTDWGDGQGKAIIGALNYLAGQGANSIYFLTMNIGGDGQDVWPWTGTPRKEGHPDNDNTHFDISKLSQWERVFAHAQRKGIFLHFVFNEAEAGNKQELDGGELGVERKLYYREMIARFGHHLALEWNLCEEYNIGFDFGPDRIRHFADYVMRLDPYDHPVTVHSAGDPLEALRFTYGDPRFSLTSVQLNQRRIDAVTEAIRQATDQAGRPLPVSMDEFTIDMGQNQSWIPVDNAELQRKQKLWPVYFSGGMIEFILEGLLEVNSFKTPEREALWSYVASARAFMEQNLPYWNMNPADALVTGEATLQVGLGNGKSFGLGAQVLSKPGEIYAVYFPRANRTGSLDLSSAEGEFLLRWYDPRNGRFAGSERLLEAGGEVNLGPPPADPEEDWVALLQRPQRRRCE